jgi:hypothetical protein
LTAQAADPSEICLQLTGSLEGIGISAAPVIAIIKLDRGSALAALDARRDPGLALRAPTSVTMSTRTIPDMNKFAFSIAELIQLIPASRAQIFIDIREQRLLAVKWHRMTWVLRADLLDYLARLPACEIKAPNVPTAPSSIVAPSTIRLYDNGQVQDEKLAPMTARSVPTTTILSSPARRPRREGLAIPMGIAIQTGQGGPSDQRRANTKTKDDAALLATVINGTNAGIPNKTNDAARTDVQHRRDHRSPPHRPTAAAHADAVAGQGRERAPTQRLSSAKSGKPQ